MRELFEPRLEQILAFCARDPVERVFLEDVARRGLGRFVAVAGDDGLAALCHLGAPREDRPGQPVFSLEDPPAPGDTGLRPATPEDLGRLLPACALAHEEELGVNPLARDPEGFRWRTGAQIEDGRSWVWLEDGVILFKAEASAWTPAAVQLQQVWVDPEARRHGYAQRALRDLCRLLLERTPSVCLFVRPENAPALALYRSIGMRHVLDYRSVIL